MNTREEATVVLGADVGSIEKNLGIGAVTLTAGVNSLRPINKNIPNGGVEN
jgi:hypothetical protein